MAELKIGMTVYIVPVGINNTRHIKGNILNHIREEKVSKIGRKYFYLEGSHNKFNMSNLRHVSEHHYDFQAYLDKQDIIDEVEFSELHRKIKSKFDEKPGLTLEQLRAINKIIFNDGELLTMVNEMLEEANKKSKSSASGYDEGFYVGRADALEDVLNLIERNNK